MRKFMMLFILVLNSFNFIFSQGNTAIKSTNESDTIFPSTCAFEYTLEYDSLTFIPDGPDCAGMSNCYNTNVTYNSFPVGEVVLSESDIHSVCLNIEHSYLGDLQIRLVCPNGGSTILHSQPNGGGLYLGVPIDDSGGCVGNPTTRGVGWNYCWSNNPDYSYHGTAPNYLHQGQTTNCDPSNPNTHSNFYHPMNSFAGLIGCPLNGVWSIEVCDLYGIDDGWVWSWSLSLKNVDTTVVGGVVYYDQNQNCQRDFNEIGISNLLGLIQPVGIYVQTNNSGMWQIDSLPTGNYSLEIDTTNQWNPTCGNTQFFSINNNSGYVVPCIGLYTPDMCTAPNVSIFSPFFRPCFSNQQIFVMAENLNTTISTIDSAYVDVYLDTMIYVNGASSPYTFISPDLYRFNIGSLYPGQQRSIIINASISCNAVNGQTLCTKAEIHPIAPCNIDSVTNPVFSPGVNPCMLPWDNSNLSVTGWCDNDSVYFNITNTASPVDGNMQCYSPVRVYQDGILSYFDSLMIAGGQSLTYAYLGDGKTWILQTDQHPLHPGNSSPSAHVEACGNINNWTPGLVNDFPLDDLAPFIDVFCREVTTSYDPNHKVGYPYGINEFNVIASNQQLQYSISFQNTGSDTAFTVVLRDTLDENLNIFSIIPGVASHPYTFRIYGQGILEWTFNQILLPDSSTNEIASNGFATFTVSPRPGLIKGTVISNKADIYFDFNLPITTNTTIHTIGEIQTVFPTLIELQAQNDILKIYPNPAKTVLNIRFEKSTPYNLTLFCIDGRMVMNEKSNSEHHVLNIASLDKGIYLLKVSDNNRSKIVKVVIQ